MQTHFEHTLGENTLSLTLKRFPRYFFDKNLQAWDSTDRYFLRTLEQSDCFGFKTPTIAVVNDDFGAITCALVQAYPDANIIHWSDSKVAQLGAQQNLADNALSDSNIAWVNSLDMPDSSIDIALVKVPKNHDFFFDQCATIKPLLHATSQFFAGSKAPLLNNSVQKIVARTIGDNKTGLAWKKSRLLQATIDTTLVLPEQSMINTWAAEEFGLTLSHHSNVFGRQYLDIGARFLLKQCGDIQAESVIDLGCGNGVLGCYLLKQGKAKRVIFVDESYHAIASARRNVELNAPELLEQCEFVVSDCLAQVNPYTKHDLILCNPPFHQQHAVTEHIARQMFIESVDSLKDGGELRVVANRHLDYGEALKKRFGGFRVLATNQKFTVFSCINQR